MKELFPFATKTKSKGCLWIERCAIGFQVLSSLLLLAAARGDLWLDEIWSLSLVNEAETPVELFTRFKHDNNHLLNSLYAYMVGNGRPMLVYRLLAVVSGIGSLILIGKLGRKWSSLAGLLAVLLLGCSYPVILYSSEARGYGPAMFFSLAAFWSLYEVLLERDPSRRPLFWGAVVLAMLSHFSFIMVFLAMCAWFLLLSVSMERSLGEILVQGVMTFGVPALFLTGFYLGFIQEMQIGGGPVYGTWEVVGRASSMALGFPTRGLYPFIALLAFLLLLGLGTMDLRREESGLWTFFPLTVVLSPMMIIGITEPELLYFRYFLLGMPFFYLLVGHLLATCIQVKGPLFRWPAILVLGVMLFGHGTRILDLLQVGRGTYREALTDIAEQTTSEEAVVGSDHDFRNRTLIAFHESYLHPEKPFAYVTSSEWADQPPEWFITHTQDLTFVPAQSITLRSGGVYDLFAAYPYSGVSGWSWFVYRKSP